MDPPSIGMIKSPIVLTAGAQIVVFWVNPPSTQMLVKTVSRPLMDEGSVRL